MKAQWIVMIVLGGVAVIGAAAFLVFGRRGPDLSGYLSLREPRIARMDDERVLEVRFSGPADTVISQAYGLLFKAYYAAKGVPKGPGMRPPKARYSDLAGLDFSSGEGGAGLKSRDWKGAVAIPIPADAVPPAPRPGAGGMTAAEGTWRYGEVAEILHLGSYETEAPTIDRLARYIEDKGYKIVGDHEEEYLKGPGYGKVDPKDYWTIIRYRVEKSR